MTHKALASLGLLMTICTACSKDDDNDSQTKSVPGAPFLSLTTDFTPPTAAQSLKLVGDAEIKSSLASALSAFMANDPDESALVADDASTEDTGDGSDLIGSSMSAVKVVASGDTFYVDAELDISTQLGAVLNAVGTSVVKKAAIKIALNVQCPGKDLSALNGKTVAEMSDIAVDPCKGAEVQKSMTNISSEIHYTLNVKSDVFSSELETHSISKSAKVGADGGYCVWTLNGTTKKAAAGCQDLSLSSTLVETADGKASERQGKISYNKFLYNDLTENDDETSQWYTGGTISAKVENWTGTFTFTGAAVPPTYTLTDDGGKTVSGSAADLQSSASLVTHKIFQPNIRSLLRNYR